MVRYGKHRNIQVTGHGNITTKRIIQQLISCWKVMWYLTVWILDMMRKRWSCMISSSLQNRVRRLHLLVLPEQERPRSPIWSTVFMISRMERSVMMVSISIRSKKQICVGLWGLFFRIRSCLRIRLWKISVTESWMLRMKRWSRRLNWRMRMDLSGDCRMAIRRNWRITVPIWARGRDSFCLSPVQR